LIYFYLYKILNLLLSFIYTIIDLTVEGIFRKNGNIRRLNALSEALDKNPDNINFQDFDNSIQLAALLKKFLRELPEPLLTFKLHKYFIQSQSK